MAWLAGRFAETETDDNNNSCSSNEGPLDTAGAASRRKSRMKRAHQSIYLVPICKRGSCPSPSSPPWRGVCCCCCRSVGDVSYPALVAGLPSDQTVTQPTRLEVLRNRRESTQARMMIDCGSGWLCDMEEGRDLFEQAGSRASPFVAGERESMGRPRCEDS